jgi:hypothetical protein
MESAQDSQTTIIVDGLSQLLEEIVRDFPKLRFLHLRFKSNRYIYVQVSRRQFYGSSLVDCL